MAASPAVSRGFGLTIREGPRVRREQHASLDGVLAALEAALDALAPGARRHTVDLRYRRFEPAQQVAVRGEVRGPGGVRGGVDLRGDGTTEAFVGRWRRRALPQDPGETAYDALRRELEAD